MSATLTQKPIPQGLVPVVTQKVLCKLTGEKRNPWSYPVVKPKNGNSDEQAKCFP